MVAISFRKLRKTALVFVASYFVMLLVMTALQTVLNTAAESRFLIQYMDFSSTVIYALMVTLGYFSGAAYSCGKCKK